MFRKIALGTLTVLAAAIAAISLITPWAPIHWSHVTPRLVIVIEVWGGMWLHYENNYAAFERWNGPVVDKTLHWQVVSVYKCATGNGYFRLDLGLDLLPIAILLSVWPACAYTLARIRRAMRTRRGQCLECGYDLTGNVSGVCPECGKPCVRAG